MKIDGWVESVDASNNTLYVGVSRYPKGIIRVVTNLSLTNLKSGDIVEIYGTFTGG